MEPSTSALLEHPSGLFLQPPDFPGGGGWFAGFTTLRAGGTMEAVLQRLGLENLPVFRPKQVHGSRVLSITPADDPAAAGVEADGLATGRRGIVLAVASADCVPMILFDPAAGAGAVLHAGWRGTVRRMPQEGVRALRDGWGATPRNVMALLGPCIGPCCYRVGEEVVRAFGDEGIAGPDILRSRGDSSFIDLSAANRLLLEEVGIPARNISSSGLCTRCRSDLFPSYRREGARAGRILAFLGSSPAASA